MSYFGKNIKKLRSVQQLSQQAFAEIFELKRGTLGAYEEGRSEPRIETILKIANYFSISVDDLLTTELTVNQLLNFKGDLTFKQDSKAKSTFPKVLMIAEEWVESYGTHGGKKDFLLNKLPEISVPLQAGVYRALEVTHSKIFSNLNYKAGDVLIGCQTRLSELNKGDLIFGVRNSSLFIKIWEGSGQEIKSASKLEVMPLGDKDVRELWKVTHALTGVKPASALSLEERVLRLENELLRK